MVLPLLLLWGTASTSLAQIRENTDNEYHFKVDKKMDATPVQNQARTGTCWSFASLSFLESEMIREGKDPVNLSEMYLVRRAYNQKALKYVRMHGTINFGEGGELHDVLKLAPKYGLVPESVYNGLDYGTQKHNHGELFAVLDSYVHSVIENKNGDITPVWDDAYKKILDTYLGETPKKFKFEGKTYTPEKFFKDRVGINPDDYIEVTSFTHEPFYKPYVMQIPDNWEWGEAYNVPLADFTQIIEQALENGYTVGWASDVSDPGFSFKKGLAIVPQKPWADMSKEEKEKAFTQPVPQRKITQAMRQDIYNNYELTDDHAMHIIGLAHDQDNTPYFLVKNSWGTDNEYHGYLFASEAYVQYKSTAIMVNKNALPKKLREKLGV